MDCKLLGCAQRARIFWGVEDVGLRQGVYGIRIVVLVKRFMGEVRVVRFKAEGVL